MITPRNDHMHLAAFALAGPVSGCHGGWRHPAADTDLLSAGYYTRLGQLLEQGRFDMLFLADILAIPRRPRRLEYRDLIPASRSRQLRAHRTA